MSTEPTRPEDTDDVTALVSKSRDELASRASLVSRGLRDITEQLWPSVEVALDKGMELLRQKKFDAAIAVCDAALKTDPYDQCLWQLKGVCLAEKGDVEQGLECFDRALEADSENPHCWFLKSRLLRRVDRTENELKCLRRVLDLESKYQGAWREIGNCLLQLGIFEQAVHAFDSELKLNPSDAQCRSQREIAQRAGRSAQTEEVKKEPAYSVAYTENKGWHVVKDDDVGWEFDQIAADGMVRLKPPSGLTLFGPFFSNYDPEEGPVGSGKQLAEEELRQKKELYPNGPTHRNGKPRA